MTTKIIAHRGDTEVHPENTLAAFSAALDKKADAIELDVHFTRDHQLAVHHDYRLGNPDNGEGLIANKNLDYIKTLTIHDGQKIPTLEEAFALLGDKLQYEIELKAVGREFLKAVLDAAERFELLQNIEFTSPHAYNLTSVKAYQPNCITGSFIAPLPGWMDKKLGQNIVIENALLGGINVLHCHIDMIDKEFIRQAHASNLLVHAADCNTAEDLRAAFSIGVDQISTNKLELALSLRP